MREDESVGWEGWQSKVCLECEKRSLFTDPSSFLYLSEAKEGRDGGMSALMFLPAR